MSDQVKIEDGGPAFPLPSHTRRWDDDKECYVQDEGMSLRDYFAGQALAGLMATVKPVFMGDEEIAARALSIADELIKQRKENK